MRKLSLRPYPGTVVVCATPDEFVRARKKLFREDGPSLDGKRGRMEGKWDEAAQWPTYIVWGETNPYLTHELVHVILHVFELAGIDPREASGEPFCYMLSQLLTDLQ